MNAAQQRVADVGRLSLAANKAWTSTNRELLAYIAEDQPTFWKAIFSFIQLEHRSEIVHYEPSRELYTEIITRAFLTLLDDGTIHLAEPISSMAQEALDQLRRFTGIGAASLPAPVVELTPEQKLEAQIIADFANLSSDAFRAKLNGSTSYRAAYRRLAAEGRINVGTAPATDLDAQVIADFKTLGTREFRRKMHDSPAYAEAYRRLSETNAISL